MHGESTKYETSQPFVLFTGKERFDKAGSGGAQMEKKEKKKY